ncbi:hypothetical protein ERJ75_000357900 [Trypanosoma vivax]|uniref:Sfi1 spindle body domain-containing protein n=1 Tax=Trypanosoma vivax (strain Y486) TaxID=1055687 RepID=G0TZU3_TRYVY|nr:hypothetical protein TRVL_01471 [Trypanosoma vivax]KAH8617727.1 hypothetical protein ERJ75_000357900 [Trypanosoma vivax]CCC50121.1 conserved hypothetical protein [Trypanosoma vivax Y486]
MPLEAELGNAYGSVRDKWTPLLELLALDSEVADGTPISLMIVAHVTYRSMLLSRVLHRWVRQLAVVREREHHRLFLAVEWFSRRRLFLFFRAWQWKHSERQRIAANIRSVQVYYTRRILQRAFNAWNNFVRDCWRRHGEAARLCDQNSMLVLSRSWSLWQKWSLRRLACRRLCLTWRSRTMAGWWTVWCHGVLRAKRHRLLAEVVMLHVPNAWGVECVLPKLPSIATPTAHCVPKQRFLRSRAVALVALRFYFIHWLGAAVSGRGRRLLYYESICLRIKSQADLRRMSLSYQTWLLRTVGALQLRRTSQVTLRRFFSKWCTFLSLESTCRHFVDGVRRHLRLSIVQHWTKRARLRADHRQLEGVANAFHENVRRSCQLPRCFARWRGTLRRRDEYRKLELEAYDRRIELLRDVAVNRLLDDVLLNFWKPPEFQKAAAVSATHTQLGPSHVGAAIGSSAKETAQTGPANVSWNHTDDGGGLGTSPVDAFRARLACQSVAIPLGTGSNVSRNSRTQFHADEVPVVHNNHSSAALKLDASPPNTFVRTANNERSHTEAVSLRSLGASSYISASSSTLFPVCVKEGRKLIESYRMLLATAASEHEEMAALREKLRLYKVQRRLSGSLSPLEEHTEAQLHQRLLALRHRELDRRALRAQVTQLTKQLEIRLSSSCSSA